MTTIINLNILNVFGRNADKNTVHNNQLNTNSSKRREKSFPDHRTIDVTPSYPAIPYNKPALDKIRNVPVKVIEQPEVLTCYPEKSETYIFKAYSTVCFMPKGTNIDSYA
jgi:hypothetical protein